MSQSSRQARLIFSFGQALGALALCLMVAHISIDVALQALIDLPLRGTSEIVSEIYMPFVVFGALAAVQERREEIRVDLVSIILPARINAMLDRLVQALVLVAALWLAWHTGEQALRAMMIGERIELGTFAVASWPGKLILPFAFAFLALSAAVRAMRP